MSDHDQENKAGKGNNNRRRRRRKSGQGGGQSQGGGQRSGNNGGDGQGRRRRRRRRNGVGGGGGNRGPRRPIDPFELFAAFHLGLGESGNYRKQGVREVSKRFGCGQQDIHDALRAYNMDRNSLMRLRPDFDVKFAELDIKVAPEGIDRGEVARERYQDFVDAGIDRGLFTQAPSVSILAPEDEADNAPEEDDSGDGDGFEDDDLENEEIAASDDDDDDEEEEVD